MRPEHKNKLVSENPVQAIITSYKFNCFGVITEWRAFVEGSGGGHVDSQPYTISFQVWRPINSLFNNDTFYNMIGMNYFSPIPLADEDSTDRGLVTGRVPETERIEIHPGDVVGYYLESSKKSDDSIQYAGDSDNDPDYSDEMVWYATGDGTTVSSMSLFPYCSSSNNEFMCTNRAPLITATVSKYINSLLVIAKLGSQIVLLL